MSCQTNDVVEECRRVLAKQLAPAPIRLRVNRNRVTYLSHIRREGVHHISLHKVFIEEGPDIWKIIGQFCLRADSRVRAALDDFVEAIPKDRWLQATRPDLTPLRPVGDIHDLNLILVRALDLGFGGCFPIELPRIGWGRNSRGGRSVRLGSYDSDRHVIRINAGLDNAHIPEDYIAAIVHHELLHALHRPEKGRGHQRIVHTRSFRAAERRFPLFDWAQRFEKDHLDVALKQGRRRA